LRLLRPAPPGLAAKSKGRARIVAAALEQAEQLARSAERIGPAAQPLPLFYALSQAGRAVAAVHLKDQWELTAHGLRWPGDAGQASVLERLIEPQAGVTSSFQRVAAAVGSQTLSAPIELGAVWTAIWELALPRLPFRKSEWKSALTVVPSAESGKTGLLGTRVTGLVVGLDDISSRQAIVAELQHYPTARDGKPEVIPANLDEIVITEPVPGLGQVAPRVVWIAENQTRAARDAIMNRVAPPYRSQYQRGVFPELPTGDFLSPLMLWWALLFGLSNLARYEPAVWTAALDLNCSPLAVPLESAMREALDSIPHLVLEALLGRFVELHSY
jgi:hypothetical protein